MKKAFMPHCTVVLAHLSYRWFEQPVLRLRDRFR